LKTYRSPREVLAAVGQALARKPSRTVPTSPLEEAVRILHCGRHYLWTSVYLLVGDRLVRASSAGPENACASMELSEGIVGRAARTGMPQAVADVSGDPNYRAALPQTVSELAVPIKIAAHVFGVLNVESAEADALGSEDRVLIKSAAGRLARFLVGDGKYVMRKAAELGPARVTPFRPVKQQPRSESPKDMRAAAGAKFRP
jgi:putative methionine-R-sulfoxide reductase with GAF domain